jgi:hypothetical protein
MASWEGFWQVVYDDAEEEIIEYPALFTTVALRRVGFTMYLDGCFIEIRAEAKRHPPVGWPPTEAELIANFRTVHVAGGKCEWRATGEGVEVETHADVRSGSAREAQENQPLHAGFWR